MLIRTALVLLWSATATLRAQNEPGDVLPKGVTPEIAAAINRGLEYIARTQNGDGSWRNSGGFGSYPTAMTALAGMALLGSGSTPTRGRYYRQVRKAAEYLIRCQGADGTISSLAEEGRSMYGHGFSTMFLGEVYGMEEDRRRQDILHDVLTKAVQLTARSQSRAGGWLYSPDQNGDEGSVTVTQIQALRCCRNAGILVPAKTIDNAVAYIRNSSNPDGSIRYSVQGSGGGRPPITAAAVAVLYNAGKYDDPLAEKALEYARRTLPINGSGNGHHYYSHLYLSQSLWQRGGAEWEEYFASMSKWLLTQQQRDGSWVGDGVGTTYGTAIALTILQLPYSYVPIYQR